jgi:peptidoglycan/xylan/chitin deacetylase (PgdA/CDA1 family)
MKSGSDILDPSYDGAALENGGMNVFRAESRHAPESRSRSFKSGLYSLAHTSGLTRFARRRFAGAGSILILHEIQNDPSSQLMTGVSIEFLDGAIAWLKSSGWQFQSLDQLAGRIADPPDNQRFITITLDDGYRDNLQNALPVFERYQVPFTLYVPTAAITRDLYSWWLGLRRLFQIRDVVEVEAMNRRFECGDLNSKIAGLAAVTGWVHQDYRRKAQLEPTFAKFGISFPVLNSEFFLDTDELKALGQHPLATIGSHTSTHPALSVLEPPAARREMDENRSYLENLLQKPVRHLAYPYGDRRACGPREGALAAELGFHTAVTTRRGRIWGAHARHPHALPRIAMTPQLTLAALDVHVSGLKEMLGCRRRVVVW